MSYEMLAKRVVDWLHRDIENRDYYDIIRYGLEILISTIGNLILTILIAVLFHIEIETLVYCLFFIPYRFVSGGAHASTHVRCFVTFTVCQVGVIAVSKLPILHNLYASVNVLFAIISLLVCIIFATGTKQIAEEKRRKYKRLSTLIVAADGLIITGVSLYAAKVASYMFIASMALLVQSIALLPIYSKKRRE